MSHEIDDGYIKPHHRQEVGREHWHVGKEIPLALIVVIMTQTAAGIWWLSGVSTKLDSLSSQVKEMKDERYTRNDAMRDTALVNQMLHDMDRRVTTLEARHK
ncbi:MAG: hypothetical protein HY016_02980 [Nitrosomonadales bacterium]|nr:hypothetical protein [Nitrosomonadales bacterium]